MHIHACYPACMPKIELLRIVLIIIHDRNPSHEICDQPLATLVLIEEFLFFLLGKDHLPSKIWWKKLIHICGFDNELPFALSL